MADVKKIATRDSYGNALKDLGASATDLVVLDADLAGATKTVTFQKTFPERHFDCGIAEANMMDVAAGLSTMGLVPFASTFAMFAAGRAYEQVRNTIGYPHLNVKIGATHGGISVGEDGASHQCCEDFALMRSIPGMTVMCPSDDVEARQMVRAAYEMTGPTYVSAALPRLYTTTRTSSLRLVKANCFGTAMMLPSLPLASWSQRPSRPGRLWPRRAFPPVSSTCQPSNLWTLRWY